MEFVFKHTEGRVVSRIEFRILVRIDSVVLFGVGLSISVGVIVQFKEFIGDEHARNLSCEGVEEADVFVDEIFEVAVQFSAFLQRFLGCKHKGFQKATHFDDGREQFDNQRLFDIDLVVNGQSDDSARISIDIFDEILHILFETLSGFTIVITVQRERRTFLCQCD